MGNMTFDIRGAKAQMPVSADEKNFIEEYDIEMAYAGVPKYSDFSQLSDAEKLEWIKTNDAEAYKTLINRLHRVENGN